MTLTYLKIHTDAAGISHFGEATLALTSTDFAPPAPAVLLSAQQPATHGFLLLPAGWTSDWHPAPARQWMCLLSGTVDVEVGDGEVRRVCTGQILLLEDTHGCGHESRVVGDAPAVLSFAQVSPESSRRP